MAAWKRPDLPAGPLRDLNDALHELRARSGLSSRQIGLELRRRYGTAPPHTTIHRLFTQPQLPPSDLVVRVSEALLAAQRAIPSHAHDQVLDYIEQLWQLAAREQPRAPAWPDPPPAPGPGTASWQLMAPGPSAPHCVLRDVVAVDPSHAWAVGMDSSSPAVERWDGTSWSREPLPGVVWRGGLHLVAADSPGSVVAVGSSSGPDPGESATRVLHYDGTAWREIPFPLESPGSGGSTGGGRRVGGLAVVGGHAWLVGQHGRRPLILEWDGRSWREHRPPAAGPGTGPGFCHLLGITAFATDDVWACGNGGWPGFQGPLLFHWDGRGWHTVHVDADQHTAALHAITGRSAEDLWAVGNSAFGPPSALAVHGDAESWHIFADLPPVQLAGVAQDASGRPWLLENSGSGAALASLDTITGSWVHAAAPRPPETDGLSLSGITAVPGTPAMLAVGSAFRSGTPQAVILRYTPPPNPVLTPTPAPAPASGPAPAPRSAG